MPGWLNEIMFDACILQAIASLMDCQATSEEALACVRKAALVVGSVIVIGGVCYLVVQSGGTILLVPAVAL